MSTVNDATRSKRPIKSNNDGSQGKEMADIIAQQHAVEEVIERLESLINAKETNPQYKIVLQHSRARLDDIARFNMSVPVDQVMKHAEIVGQYNERIKIVEELMNDRRELDKQKSYLGILVEKVRKILEQTKKG